VFSICRTQRNEGFHVDDYRIMYPVGPLVMDRAQYKVSKNQLSRILERNMTLMSPIFLVKKTLF